MPNKKDSYLYVEYYWPRWALKRKKFDSFSESVKFFYELYLWEWLCDVELYAYNWWYTTLILCTDNK